MTSSNFQKTSGGIGPASKYDWGDYFPHSHPYPDQVRAIRTFHSIAGDHGYYVMEGPCGSGKTTISLTGTLGAIDDETTDASKVAVVTPLTSQREQFMNELQDINANRSSGGHSGDEPLPPVPALEVAGKHEYIPYAIARTGAYGKDDTDQYSLSNDIKDRTDELLLYTTPYEVPVGDFLPEDTKPCGRSDCSKDAPKDLGYCYPHARDKTAEEVGKSPAKARAMLNRLVQEYEDSECLSLDIDGETYDTPYPDTIPFAHEVANLHEDGINGRIDPFRLGYYAEEEFEMEFDRTDNHVMTVGELVKNTAARGICPYRTLYDLLCLDDTISPQVVVGNYHHILNPRTRFLFEKYRGPDTLLVIDEAHMLAEKARDLLGSSRSLTTLNGTQSEWQRIKDLVPKPTPAGKEAAEKLESIGFSRVDIHEIENFFDTFAEIARNYAQERVADEFKSHLPSYPDNLPQYEILGIADIGEDTDPLTAKIEAAAQGNEVWEKVYDNPRAVGIVLREIYDMFPDEDDDDYSSTAHAAFYLADWIGEADRDTYLRELELSRKEDPPPGEIEERPLRAYNAQLNLYSTIPNKALFRNVFEEYGGGIIMSATLEPLDQFTFETGIDMVEEKGRPVETDAYDMRFPEENRRTFVVPNHQYVGGTRGEPTTNDAEKTGLRKWYEGTLVEIGQTYGNIMFVLPSKSEAYCMGEALIDSQDVSKRVYIDQGGDGVLESFRRSDEEAILVTYANGTLTTGVDYSGDELHTVGVVGVSYPPPTDRIEAVCEVYGEKFDNGYQYGVTVPTVRETRQAIGRPIRGTDEGGVRLLIDERYIGDKDDRQVYDCLPQRLMGEIELCDRDELKGAIDGFWDYFHMF